MSSEGADIIKPPYIIAAESIRKNKGQWKAYESQDNCVILAGPGSGKTKTLTVKMARMLAEDVKAPRGIACITFNNQCARELKRRLVSLGVEDGKRTFIGTLHSFCLQHIVLPYARLAGIAIPEPLKVAMTSERNKCWEIAVDKIKGTDEPWEDWSFRCDVYRRTHLDRDKPEWYEDHEDAARIIEVYEAALQAKGLVDFDTMILTGLRLVEQHAWVRRAIRARFPILVVDEYQDLGYALHRLVLSLCFKAGIRILAVGDPDQSIYGFTGAEPALLQDFASRDGIEVVRLDLNYRCGPTIIQASEIALGETRGFKSINDEEGTLYSHNRPLGFEDQANFICDSIIPAALGRRKERTLGDIVVLYPNRYDGDVIARAVEARNWNFIRSDQGNPYPRSPVIFWLEDCAAWCAGGWQEGSPRLSELIRTWLRFNESASSDERRRQLKRSLVRFLHSNRKAEQPLRDWLSSFREDCLDESLQNEPRLRDENDAVEMLAKECAVSARLGKFTVSAFGGQGGSRTHLNLMTLHSAKGLEFDVVVMMALEEGKLPDYRSSRIVAKLLEARRLFYVGLTRAKDEVHLVYSGWYKTSGGGIQKNGESRFIKELLHLSK